MFITYNNGLHLKPKEYNRNMSNRSGNFGHELSDEGVELYEALSQEALRDPLWSDNAHCKIFSLFRRICQNTALQRLGNF